MIFISMKKEVESLISLPGTKTLGKGMILLAGLYDLVFLVHPREGESFKGIIALCLVVVTDLLPF